MERQIDAVWNSGEGRYVYGTAFPPEGLEDAVPAAMTRAELERALQNRSVLCGVVVMCDHRSTLWVELGCMRGRIAREEVQLCGLGEEVRDIAIITRVGKTVAFVVCGFTCAEDGEEIAVLSRREAQQRCRAEYLDRLCPGDVICARITHLEPFGAFVDVGCGIVSMLPIDSISVSRISHPEDRFAVGMPIRVVIRSLIPGGRICVTHKELLGTWEENAALFQPGQTVTGIVRSMETYGVFIELTPNLAGLAEYRDGLHVGQYAAVYIKSMIPARMKVKLAVVDVCRGSGCSGLRYYLPDTVGGRGVPHLERWQYSPNGAEKCVESVFGPL